jgi:hypothetical protein
MRGSNGSNSKVIIHPVSLAQESVEGVVVVVVLGVVVLVLVLVGVGCEGGGEVLVFDLSLVMYHHAPTARAMRRIDEMRAEELIICCCC